MAQAGFKRIECFFAADGSYCNEVGEYEFK